MEEWLHPSIWPLWMAAFGGLAYALLFLLARRRMRQPVQSAPQPRPQTVQPSEPVTRPSAPMLQPAPVMMMDRSISIEDDHRSPTLVHEPDEGPVSAAEVSAPEQSQLVCVGLLSRAQSQIEAGDTRGAAATLRDAIRLAASSDLPSQHAAARLELGELARQDGDLITACEHWQIARGLFHDLKNSARVKSTEARMRDQGCPTDWVLTDF